MDKSRMLRVLKRTLAWYEKGNDGGVCNVMSDVTGPKYRPERMELRRRFFARPGGYTYVTSWLENEHFEVYAEAFRVHGLRWKNAYRMAWIKHVMEIIENE